MKTTHLFRFLLVTGVLLVLFLGGVMTVMAYRHQKSTRLFKEGETAYLRGDYETAEATLRRYLRRDPNKEDAWKYLAEISDKRESWFYSSYYWGRLVSLNPLDDEYVKNCIRANYRLHNYAELNRIFQSMKEEKRASYHEIFVLTKFKVEPEEEATRTLIEELPADSVMARLIRALELLGPVSELAALEEADDVVIRVEAYVQDAAIAEWQEKNLARAEECYRKAAELNPLLCYGEVGNFLYRQRKYAEAVEVYRQIPDVALSLPVILNYAEALFYLKEQEPLQKLEQLVPKNERYSISSRAYIHCLLAVLKNNAPEMIKNYNVAQLNRRTPIGILVSYTVAVESRNIPLLVSILSIWKKTTIFQAKLPDILERVRPILQDAMAERQWTYASALAELFLDEKPPQLLAWEACILARAANKNLTDELLQQAISLFPQEALFRAVALRRAAARGDFAASLAAFDELIAASDSPNAERYRKVIFLERNQRLDEAFQELKKIVEADDSLVSHKHCLSFGIRTGNQEALEIAANDPNLASLAAFEKERRYGDIDKAVSMLKDQPLEQGLDAVNEEDRELLLPLAIYLGIIREHTRAIALYEALSPYVTQNSLIDINLSEIYSDLGNKELALQYGEKAFRRFPNSELARTIYGIRNAESGNYEQAARLISDTVPSEEFKKILIFCLEQNIEKQFENKHYATCRNSIQRLQHLQSDNATVQEYLDKLNQLNEEVQEEPQEEPKEE